MADRRRRWIPIVLGILFVLVCLAIGAGIVAYSMFRQNIDVRTAEAPDASSAFDEIRQRYGDRPALLEVRDGRLRRAHIAAPAAASPTALAHLRVIVWDPSDRRLARIAIPFWLLRLKTTPIRFRDYAHDLDETGDIDEVTIAELEAHGPGVLFDNTSPEGERVLVWLE